MPRRRGARRLALEALFETELRGASAEEVLQRSKEAGPYEFALELVRGVIAQAHEIDEVIEKYSDDWTMDRMPVIDKNILRIGVFELLFLQDMPSAVTINEAVELAKQFSTDDSGRFVNGLLSAVSQKEKSRV